MKKILFFLLVLASFTLSAQNEQMREMMRTMQPSRNVTDVPAENIQFWVGSGSNEVVAAFFFCNNPAVGIAYGYRFNSTATILDMLNAIQSADPNFTFSQDGGWITTCGYNNGTLVCSIPNGYLMYSVNGDGSSGLSDPLANGDYFELNEWGDCTLPVTNIYYPVDPSTPTAVDATISADNIIYWVGNGENEVVFVVNFCTPEAEALAWGVRFSGESAIVSDIFHTIELYDDRFNVEGTSFVTNITFADGIHDNYTTSMYWMYNVNGVTAANYADQQEVHNGDVIKFGDASCGIITDTVMYTYVWTTPIEPVELPELSTEVFDGIVGSEGCQAIKYDDAAILGWATTCEVTRGYQNIANGEGSALASYGTDNDGVGPSSESTGEGVVSLGDAGYAVLTFGMPISNGEGYDFAVFENSLNHTFLELAFVEVSSDGEHYYRFPSVSNTQTEQQISNGGALDATKINNLAGKYIVGWGTPFDLEELDGYSNLDINNVTHVRIVDVVGSINPLYGTTDKNGHLINDPYPTPWNTSGFDLSGVAVMNGWTPTAVNNYQQEISFMAYPNPCQNVLNVNNVTVNEPVSLFNAMGQQIWNGMTQDTYFQLDMQSYPAGMYMLQVGTQMTKIIKK
jgi:hypothetical protein